MAAINGYISDELKDKVYAAAEARKWRISWIVEEALEKWLEAQPKARIDPYDWSDAMDEVESALSSRVRACPHCVGEECSH